MIERKVHGGLNCKHPTGFKMRDWLHSQKDKQKTRRFGGSSSVCLKVLQVPGEPHTFTLQNWTEHCLIVWILPHLHPSKWPQWPFSNKSGRLVLSESSRVFCRFWFTLNDSRAVQSHILSLPAYLWWHLFIQETRVAEFCATTEVEEELL